MTAKPLYIAEARGFCRGVRQAISMFEEAVAASDEPCYVLHELVHNRTVTSQMLERGAIIVSQLEDVPSGSRLLFGAHGVPRQTEEAAAARSLRVIDSCCLFVRKLQQLAAELPPGSDLVLYGKAGHPEVNGILGHSAAARNFLIGNALEISALPELHSPLLLIQTTAESQEAEAVRSAFMARFPEGKCPVHICHASSERQASVLKLTELTSHIIILGSSHSSNANRLCDVARSTGAEAILVDTPAEIPCAWLDFPSLGLGASASTPDCLIEETIRFLGRNGFSQPAN